VDDDAFLVGGEVAAADAGAEVVGPTEAAALAAAHEAGVDGHGAPVAGAVLLDVGDQDDVLLRRPWPLLDAHLVAARRPPHRRRPLPRASLLSGGRCLAVAACSGRSSSCGCSGGTVLFHEACAGRLYIGQEVNVSELLFTCYRLTNLLASNNYLR
jgi:hypothetical protein